jgi:hypothetical protein
VDAVAQIARAVLYEGYLLWPYRRSALKNQHRFTLGGIYPPAYAQASGDRSASRFACLVEGRAPRADLELRFLHLVRRQPLLQGCAVDELHIGARRYLAWDEAAERSVRTGMRSLETSIEIPIVYEGGGAEEPLGEDGALLRSWGALRGDVRVGASRLREGLALMQVEVVNSAPWSGSTREAALRATLLAAHVVARVEDGAFASALDPPQSVGEEAALCRSEGLWPVLVGEEGARDTLLAAPIILYDYPRVAPESPGDLFDGTEIDELLIHSVLALTEEEKREVRDTDPRAREILERTSALTPAQLARLHGTLRAALPEV